MDIWVAQNTRVQPTIFIDDFLFVSHRSEPNILIVDLATASATPMVQAGLAAKLGQWACPKAAQTEPADTNLGADFAAGARLR
eukprot:9037834-Pyramimonas_sp.AAC.1